ncbi:MAG: efflux RND transporter periplasmic adaptor subunit [Planctomycetaceae bacterium]
MTVRHIHMPIILIGFMLTGCSGDSRSGEQPQARKLPVAVKTVREMTSYAEARTYAGTIESRQTSQLAFQRVGRLLKLLVDEGDRVQAQQVLAELDVRELEQQKLQLVSNRKQAQAQLAELEAGPRKETIAATRSSLESLEAQLTLAKATFVRTSQLRRRGGGTDQQLDDARSAVDSAEALRNSTQKQLEELLAGTRTEQLEAQRAVVQQFDAQVEAINVRIDDSQIKSPFAGTISRRHIDTGSIVNPGQAIFTVVESGKLEARIGLPARLAKPLSDAEAFSFIWRDSTVTGRLKAKLPLVEQTTRNQAVIFELDSTGEETLGPVPGDVIRLQYNETIATTGFWLPLNALTRGTRGLWSAFVVVPTNKGEYVIERVSVEVIYTTGERAFVRGTLKDGDRVIASGSHRIVPGQTVDPIEEQSR